MPLYLTATHILNLLDNTWQRKCNFQIHVNGDAVTFKFNQDASEFYHMKPLASYMQWGGNHDMFKEVNWEAHPGGVTVGDSGLCC